MACIAPHEPRHAKICSLAYADSEGPDQPAQAHQGLHFAKFLLDTMEGINGEQMPGWDFAHARDESESVHFAHVRRHIFA